MYLENVVLLYDGKPCLSNYAETKLKKKLYSVFQVTWKDRIDMRNFKDICYLRNIGYLIVLRKREADS